MYAVDVPVREEYASTVCGGAQLSLSVSGGECACMCVNMNVRVCKCVAAPL